MRLALVRGPAGACVAALLLVASAAWAQTDDQPATAPSGDSTTPRPFTIQQATFPETVIFTLMRKLSVQEGTDAADTRKEIETWRGFAHDRKRKVGDSWWDPQEFKRRRDAFANYVKDAQSLRRKVPTGAAAARDANDIRAEKEANAKTMQAVMVWGDPLLRDFLTGVAELLTKGNAAHAGQVFGDCVKAAPEIAAFHQGRGMALLELKRPLDSLEEFMGVLMLQSDSKDAYLMLKDAMQKVPGTQITRPTYVAAKDLLKTFDASSITGSGSYAAPNTTIFDRANWLMPGRWPSRGIDLPTPPYDRLVFKQAVAVPVAAGTLLADSAAVEGALAIYVEIEPGTVVSAKVRKATTSTTRGAKLPPLTLLTVTDAVFKPVGGDKSTSFETGQNASIYSASLFAEMSTQVRQIRTRLKSVDTEGRMRLTSSMLPGDSASPVISADGVLLGFAAARTDVMAEGGGPDLVVPLRDIMPLIDQAKKTAAGSGSSGSTGYSGYGTIKRTSTPVEAKGNHFLVKIVASEGPEK